MALAAVFVPPSPDPAREVVQAVLVGEPHGAVYLVGDLRRDSSGLADARFGDGGMDGEARRTERSYGAVVGATRGGDLAGQDREVVLDGLELGDGATELLSLGGVVDGHGKDVLECSCHERDPGQGHALVEILRNVDPLGLPKDHPIAALPAKLDSATTSKSPLNSPSTVSTRSAARAHGATSSTATVVKPSSSRNELAISTSGSGSGTPCRPATLSKP